MAGARTPVARTIASRLALRQGGVPPRVNLWCALWAVVVALGVGSVFAGSSHPAGVAAVGVGGILLLVGLALRWFPTAMAVSVTGIALSCASLLTVLAVTTGFEQEIVRAIARMNGHVLLTKYGLDFREYEQLSAQWERDPRVVAASPFAFSMIAVVRVEDPEAPPDPDAISRGPSVVVGKGIDPRRAAKMDGLLDALGKGSLDAIRPGGSPTKPGLVLGDALAREIGVVVGDAVRVVVPAELDGKNNAARRPPRHAEFELLDTLHTGTSELDRNLALMHLSSAQSLFFRDRRVTGIEFQLTDPRLATEMGADLEDTLGYPYRTSTWEQTNAPLLVSLRQVRVALVVILGLMTVVASSSLVASLLLIVRRKRHDVGVLLAVGGDRKLVFWVFEAVGLLAGAAGSLLGIGLGLLYCAVIAAYRYPLVGDVYPVDHLPVVITAFDIVVPVAAALLLCGLASGPVAVRAAKTRLIAALGR